VKAGGMSSSLRYVGLDVGGTTMKCGVVDDAGTPRTTPLSQPTHPERGQEAGLETMCESIRQGVKAAGLTMNDIAAIGVATPGLMDIHAGLIVDPPNLKPWKNVPVRQHVADAFKKPTAFQNDANAAAYGEFWVGAGREVNSMVLFTLGTGVGGGIIIDDKIIEGRHSHGGELGHMRIDTPDRGRLCGCGHRGCLEAYASATAVTRRAREELAAWRGPSKLREFFTANDDVFTAKEIFDTAASGDELATKIVDDTAYYLALGASAATATVDPDMVAFAGGMVAAGEAFLKRVRDYYLRYALPLPAAKTEVRFAQLGSDAGFIGAAGCARQLLKASRVA
jgi:glucokinase